MTLCVTQRARGYKKYNLSSGEGQVSYDKWVMQVIIPLTGGKTELTVEP